MRSRVVNIFLWGFVGIYFLGIPNAAWGQQCSLNRSVYRAANDRGFLLEFRPAPSGASPSTLATATISQDIRGVLFRFDVVQSQGYGSIQMVKPNQSGQGFGVYLFEAGGKQFRGKGTAPLLFVAGLGSADWYENQETGGRKIILGDGMWKFAFCKMK